MAALTTQDIPPTGIAASYSAVAGGGDTFTNDGNVMLHVKNAGASSCNVTITSAGKYKGAAVADLVVAVANGAEKFIKPYAPDITGSTAAVAWSYTTSVTVAVLRFQGS